MTRTVLQQVSIVRGFTVGVVVGDIDHASIFDLHLRALMLIMPAIFVKIVEGWCQLERM